MCTNIEFDMTDESFNSMCSLMYKRLEAICDPCSLQIYIEGGEITTEEELFSLVGKTMFNSLIVDAIQVQMQTPIKED